jgi:hypothetical protein
MKGKISKEMREIMSTLEGRKQVQDFMISGEEKREIVVGDLFNQKKFVISRLRG